MQLFKLDAKVPEKIVCLAAEKRQIKQLKVSGLELAIKKKTMLALATDYILVAVKLFFSVLV